MTVTVSDGGAAADDVIVESVEVPSRVSVACLVSLSHTHGVVSAPGEDELRAPTSGGDRQGALQGLPWRRRPQQTLLFWRSSSVSWRRALCPW